VAQTGVQDCAFLAVFAIAIFAVIAGILRAQIFSAGRVLNLGKRTLF
jgi:hypothetical protein